jgi:hypothetical protein
MVDFDAVADELYGLMPREFTAARDAYASQARQAGDRSLEEAIKSLRKPSVGAWLANLLAREDPSGIEALFGLGGQLTQAQDRLDGDEIRRLSSEKHEIVAVLLREAQTLARRADQSVSKSATEDLEATLDAAFADQEAAEALRSGRLTGALHYSGLGLADIAPAKSGSGKARSEDGSTPKAKSLRNALALAERAQQELELAVAAAQKTHDAVASAEAALQQLKVKAELADRRARDAQRAAREAKKNAELVRRRKSVN